MRKTGHFYLALTVKKNFSFFKVQILLEYFSNFEQIGDSGERAPQNKERSMKNQMKIAAVLPHVEIFGGVRRYLEVGNELSNRGYYFVLFHPDGSKPEWFDFKGITKSFSSLGSETFDIGLCSEYSVVPYFERLNARTKFFYFLLEGHKQEKEIVKKNYFFLGSSEGICRRLEKKYKILCSNAPGGVNPKLFYPVKRERKKNEFRILSYGRIYKKRKGIQYVIRAVEGLYKEYPHRFSCSFSSSSFVTLSNQKTHQRRKASSSNSAGWI